jgi:hypothetical protein
MIKTLRITSIVVAMLAVILLVLPVVFGVRSDSKIEEFLQSPGAVDNFLAAKGQRPARDESQTSPLVKQAVDFARYLNPPPPPPPRTAPAATQTAAQPAPPVPVTPKFNLIGTSFYASRPELSLALIDEPGKGLNWVRQGSTVGHLTIEQIKDGSITISDSQGTSEMTVTVNQPWRTLLKNPPPEIQPAAPSTGTGQLPSAPAAPPPAGRGRPGFGARVPTTATASQKVIAQPAPAPVTSNEPDIEVTSPAIKEQEAKIERVFSEISAISENRITGDEAAKLDELSKLAEQLEEMQAAELSARQKPQSPDQTDTNAPSDANQ